MKKILLVEPEYYTRFPPLGLLKIATYFRSQGAQVKLVKGCVDPGFVPDEIYVTSLFTYAWKSVHQTVRFYKMFFRRSKVIVGGIYASLLPDHAAESGADVIYSGVFEEADRCIPAWDLVPEWDGSIIFTSRGCIRDCPFCAVPKIEGKLREIVSSIKPYIYPKHTKVILWDNNILATKNWKEIFNELEESNRWVDFNQGLDARLINEEVAQSLTRLKLKYVRLAYDNKAQGRSVKRAINLLAEAGIRKRKIVVYTLYNFQDDPEDFKDRVAELLSWGVVCYPMKYEPLTSLKKNSHISDKWTSEELEMVAKARRVLGQAGAFPPYEGLIKKFSEAKNFSQAFSLREQEKGEKRYFQPFTTLMEQKEQVEGRYGKSKKD